MVVKMEEEKVRLFVGGLAAGVSTGDLKERFTPLGKVLNIEIPQAKSGVGHRGFAHVDFLPATDASLRKLFSAYNGCKWRGGCLRIEKAKEHYSDRLDREWAVEAASLISTTEHSESEDGQQPPEPHGRRNGESGAIVGDDVNLFFPKLRKVKAVPITGLGKHKRSFQRVESSPLHVLLTSAGNSNSQSGIGDTTNADKELISSSFGRIIERRSSETDALRKTSDAKESKVRLRDRLAVGLLNEQDSVEKTVAFGWNDPAENTNISPSRKAPVKNRVKSPSPELRETLGPDVNDEESLDTSAKDDTTIESVGRERAQQLELMKRLFPEDASTIDESVQLVPPDHAKVKKRKRKNLEDRGDEQHQTLDHTIPNDTDQKYWADQQSELERKNDQQVRNRNVMHGASHHRLGTSSNQNVMAKPGPENLTFHENIQGGEGKASIRQSESAAEQDVLGDLPIVSASESSDDDKDMVFNFGNDSISLEVAEEREKQMVRVIHDDINNTLNVETRMESSPTYKKRPRLVSETVGKSKEDYSTVDSKMAAKIAGETLILSNVEKDRAMLTESTMDEKPSNRSKDGESVPISKSKGRQRQAASSDEPPKTHAGSLIASMPISKGTEPAKTRAEDAGLATEMQVVHEKGHISKRSSPTLTRSAWKSLVGETGHVVFTLGNLTGFGGGDAPVASPIQESPKLPGGVQHQNRVFVSSEKNLKSDLGSENSPGEISKIAPTISRPPGDVCLFMRSENAEKEWLASKSELRSDYRAKHRHASRTMKKLWGRRSA